jgi:hypothetical protein
LRGRGGERDGKSNHTKFSDQVEEKRRKAEKMNA